MGKVHYEHRDFVNLVIPTVFLGPHSRYPVHSTCMDQTSLTERTMCLYACFKMQFFIAEQDLRGGYSQQTLRKAAWWAMLLGRGLHGALFRTWGSLWQQVQQDSWLMLAGFKPNGFRAICALGSGVLGRCSRMTASFSQVLR